MTVINHHIRLLRRLMTSDPESPDAILMHLLHADRRGPIPMPQQAKAEEGVRHLFGEEDPADPGRHVRKCVPDTADHDVLEDGGALDERGLLVSFREVVLVDELVR